VIGSFVGAKDTSIIAAEQTLVGLTSKTDFTTYGARKVFGNPAQVPTEPVGFSFDPATGSYVFGALDTANGGGTINHTIATADIVSAQSTAARTFYQRSDASGDISGYVSKPGSGNTEIALSYSGFADFTVRNHNMGEPALDYHSLVFGLETPVSLLPRSGSASYSGIALGRGAFPELDYTGTISGTSTLIASFAEASVAASIHVFADNPARNDLGTHDFTAAIANNGFFGGGIRGTFFGPNVDEFGFGWAILGGSGIAIGKKN